MTTAACPAGQESLLGCPGEQMKPILCYRAENGHTEPSRPKSSGACGRQVTDQELIVQCCWHSAHSAVAEVTEVLCRLEVHYRQPFRHYRTSDDATGKPVLVPACRRLCLMSRKSPLPLQASTSHSPPRPLQITRKRRLRFSSEPGLTGPTTQRSRSLAVCGAKTGLQFLIPVWQPGKKYAPQD